MADIERAMYAAAESAVISILVREETRILFASSEGTTTIVSQLARATAAAVAREVDNLTIQIGQTQHADPLAALRRADERWCKRHPHYDPAEAEYLQALAVAVAPLLDTATATDTAAPNVDPTMLAQRDQLAEELRELRAAHDELATRHGDLHREHAARRLRIEILTARIGELSDAVGRAGADAHAEAQQAITGARQRADYARVERAAALGHLRALLEAVLGEPVDGRASAEHLDALIERASQLVAAAVDQLDARFDAGVHVHQYPLDASGKPGECGCGKKFPQPKGRH